MTTPAVAGELFAPPATAPGEEHQTGLYTTVGN
jgi:hypothetical protein